MAVFEGQTRSLTPSFQNIQEALNQRAKLELQRPGIEDAITPVVQRLDQEFTKQRDFEKKLAGEGRSLFTPDMADQLSQETGLPASAYSKAIGRYYSVDEFQKIHENAIMDAAQSKLAETKGASAGLTPDQAQTLNLTGKAGKEALANKAFEKEKTGKQVPVADSTSSTGYRWAVLGPTGLTPTQFEAPAPGGAAKASEGEKSVDKKFAQIYADYVLAGGSADVKKQIDQLKGVKEELGKSSMATGPMIGSIPVSIRDAVNPRSAAMQQRVEEVVQRNLRAVLGAQFTEQEGKALIARAYNPRQPEAENVKRLNALVTQIQQAADAKQAAVDYFEANGTIKGFKGKIYTSPNDFLPENKKKGDKAAASGGTGGGSKSKGKIDTATVDKYLAENGNDWKKAEEAARADGWDF